MSGIELSFRKLKDGTYDIYADIFPDTTEELCLTAEQVKFTVREPFAQDGPTDRLFNIPYETLKKFAIDILAEK